MSRTHHPRGPGTRFSAAPDTQRDAHTKRRAAERASVPRLVADPEGDVVLPVALWHAGDPWSWS